jgi:hypothetical protein
MKLLSRVIIFLLLVSPAQARHCPRGDIWRIHANICIPKQGHHFIALHEARSEVPSHHGITYVTVVEPPPTPPPSPPATLAEVSIPFALPPSRLNHLAICHFDALPPVVPGTTLSNTARKE